MNSVEQVMAELNKKGTEQTRKTLRRHGVTGDLCGVKIADLKPIAKQIKGNQELACQLFETGNYDAMYLSGLVADGSQMTKRQLDSWAKMATCSPLCDYTVSAVASEHPRGPRAGAQVDQIQAGNDRLLRLVHVRRNHRHQTGRRTGSGRNQGTDRSRGGHDSLRAQQGPLCDEQLCHRSWYLCQTTPETGQASGQVDRRGDGRHGRYGMQGAAGHGLHCKGRKDGPSGKKTKDDEVLAMPASPPAYRLPAARFRERPDRAGNPRPILFRRARRGPNRETRRRSDRPTWAGSRPAIL